MITPRNLKRETFSKQLPRPPLVLQKLRERLLPWHHPGWWCRPQTKDGVGAVCGYTVVCVQGVQEWTEYAALRGSGVQGQYRGSETVHSHHQGSACQEVHDPVAKAGV